MDNNPFFIAQDPFTGKQFVIVNQSESKKEPELKEYTLESGGFAEMLGDQLWFWQDIGTPSYLGNLEGLREAYPAAYEELAKKIST